MQNKISRKRMKELILEGLPEYDWIKQSKLHKTLFNKKKKNSFLDAIKELVRDKKVKIKRIGKENLLYSPRAEKFVKISHNKHFDINELIPEWIFKKHAKDMRDVIQKWIIELPSYTIEYQGSPIEQFKPNKYKVDSNPLFNSLRIHLPFQNDLFDKWKEVKNMHTELETGKRDLYESICKKLRDDLKISKFSKQFGIDTLITFDFPNRIYDTVIALIEGDDDKFESYLSPVNSNAKPGKKKNHMEYWVSATGYAIVKTDEGEKEFKERMDDYVYTMIKGLKGLEFEGRLINLKKQRDQFDKFIMEIKQILEKNLLASFRFNPDCEFCRTMVD